MRADQDVLRILLGHDTPFDWQVRLFRSFLAGNPPKFLDVPTGLGKTSVMAIWLAAKIVAGRRDSNISNRLTYIVDRKTVVDQSTDEAVRLRTCLEKHPAFKERLGLANRPLPISTLRGQHADNRQWLENPASPAIIVGTVDMIGSRLLFQGYGVSRKMRPYHAGLLGVDNLIVLDEAHLVPSFEHLLRTIEKHHGFGMSPFIRSRSFRLLSLTATGSCCVRPEEVIGLTDQDLSSPVVSKRLYASKQLSLRQGAWKNEGELAKFLATQAWELVRNTGPSRILVYAESRKVIQKTAEELRALFKQAKMPMDMELVTGARRVYEREIARARLMELGFLADAPMALPYPVFLLATAAGEVGMDVDADHMVCDLVPWERMVQRLGRVNRRGNGRAIIVVGAPQDAGAVQSLLVNHLPKCQDAPGYIDVSIRSLLDMKRRMESEPGLREIVAKAMTPCGDFLEIGLPQIEEWAMTHLPERHVYADIQPWLRGWDVEEKASTRLVWRKHIPLNLEEPFEKQKAHIERFFEAAPIHISEQLEAETSFVKDWISRRAAALGPLVQDISILVLDLSQNVLSAISLEELHSKKLKKKNDDFIKNKILVVPDIMGGLEDGILSLGKGLNPASTLDGDAAWSAMVGVGVQPRSLGEDVRSPLEGVEKVYSFPMQKNSDGDVVAWLDVYRLPGTKYAGYAESNGRPVKLRDHARMVGHRAKELASWLRLPKKYRDMFWLAGYLHDRGKSSPVWQRAAGANGFVCAKSVGPLRAKELHGYIHEIGSAIEFEEKYGVNCWLDKLARHLIIGHHGRGRPWISPDGHDVIPASRLRKKEVFEWMHDFSSLQRVYGPWGLAWLEAILRASDQQVSREYSAV